MDDTRKPNWQIVLLVAGLLVAGHGFGAELNILKTGLGSGTVESTPGGIDCGADCAENFGAISVTLTATADPGSEFAGWHIDPDTDTATTPPCTGTADCTLSLASAQSIRPVFNLDPGTIPLLARTPVPGAPPGEFLAYSPEEVRDYLTANSGVNTPARFIAALPDDFRQNWLLMFRSESLQTGTARFPRILMPSADAKAVFTLGLAEHGAYPGTHPNAIEYMQWDPGQKNFRFHEIVVADILEMDFDSDGIGVIPMRPRGVFFDEPRCTRCHSTRNVLNPGPGAGTTGTSPGIVKAKNKPNWDTYDSWGGLAPFNRDRVYEGSVEAATLRKFFNPWTWQGNPLVRSIIEQLELQPPGVVTTNDITRLAGGADDGRIKFGFDDTTPVINEPIISGAGTISTNYAFNGAPGMGPSSSVVQNGQYVVMQHSETPTSSEGRGVQLFDILGGADGNFNPQRIADELLDHRFATGSVPIDIRPIVLAVTKNNCLAVDAGANAVVSESGLPALSVAIGNFMNARHGMGINELIEDTFNRAASLPRRKADNQKLTLDRTVFGGSPEPYLVGPENGLILEYGATTNRGTATTLDRIRQEIFRRPAGGQGDRSVMGGIYVDREIYGSEDDPSLPSYTDLNSQHLALYRYFLEPLGVSVDKWSMGVRGRSRTYTFADVFDTYLDVLQPALVASLTSAPVGPMTDPNDCGQLITAINSTLGSLPPIAGLPTFTDIQRIFDKSCIECHGGLDYPPYQNYGDSLDLSEEESPTPPADRLDRSHANALLRTGTDPATSFLYRRITDDYRLVSTVDPALLIPYDPLVHNENCPNFTDLMPCGGPPLAQADILTVRRWILGGTPNTRGDPHIKTVDGVNYDFQAAGEFVLLKGQNLELQARQSAVTTAGPLGPNAHTGLKSCVSVNTAAALRVGANRVTYQPEELQEVAHDAPNHLVLRVNGKAAKLGPDGIRLADGGRIMPGTAAGAIRVEAPGGTVINITPGWWSSQRLWWMHIDAKHVRATRGVMGVIAPGNWLPAMPDGSLLGPRPADLNERYVQLYDEFGKAWAVSDSSSLFDYTAGASTADFTVESWPLGESPADCSVPVAAGEPTPPPPPAMLTLAEAEQICDGVVAAEARHNCVQDVMVTAESGFAETYLHSEAFEFNVAPRAPDLVTPTNNQAGLTSSVNFTWSAADDEDGDVTTYRLCVWKAGMQPNLNECRIVEAADEAGFGTLDRKQWIGLLTLLLLVLLLLVVLLRKRPGMLVLAFVLFVSLVLIMIYFGDRRLIGGQMTHSVTGLQSGDDYYWKVIVDDGHGGITESRTQRFETD